MNFYSASCRASKLIMASLSPHPNPLPKEREFEETL